MMHISIMRADKNFEPLRRKIIDDAGTGVCVTSIATQTHTCRRNQDAVHLNQYTGGQNVIGDEICILHIYTRFELQIYFCFENQNNIRSMQPVHSKIFTFVAPLFNQTNLKYFTHIYYQYFTTSMEHFPYFISRSQG